MLFVNNSRLTITVMPPYINIADTITPRVQAHNFILKNLHTYRILRTEMAPIPT